KQSGKIAFAKALGTVAKEDRRFFSSLSELRNKIVHNVANAQFDLKKHVSSLPPEQFKAFAKNLDSASQGGVSAVAGREIPPLDFFRENPKLAIFMSAMYSLAITYQNKEIAKLARERDKIQSFLLRLPAV